MLPSHSGVLASRRRLIATVHWHAESAKITPVVMVRSSLLTCRKPCATWARRNTRLGEHIQERALAVGKSGPPSTSTRWTSCARNFVVLIADSLFGWCGSLHQSSARRVGRRRFAQPNAAQCAAFERCRRRSAGSHCHGSGDCAGSRRAHDQHCVLPRQPPARTRTCRRSDGGGGRPKQPLTRMAGTGHKRV